MPGQETTCKRPSDRIPEWRGDAETKNADGTPAVIRRGTDTPPFLTDGEAIDHFDKILKKKTGAHAKRA